MKLLLASDSDFVFEKGFDLLGIPADKLKVAYITTASKGSDNPRVVTKERKQQIQKYHLEPYDIEGKTKTEIEKFVADKNVIFVKGGNVFYLLRAIRDTDFDKILKDQIEKGKVYIGVSAGAYIVCPTIETALWLDQDRNRFGVTDYFALNLVPFLIRAHYEPGQKELLQENVSDCRYDVKLLKDGQGMLFDGGNFTLVGDGERIVL